MTGFVKFVFYVCSLWFKAPWKLLCEFFRCMLIIDNDLTYLIAAKGEVS